MKYLPKWSNANSNNSTSLYYWLWGTRAMSLVGGEDWKIWKSTVKDVLIKNQRKDGCEDGSWDTDCAWGICAGRACHR
ncbi:hypothetical protein ES708_26739 [subsurface metagenome]